MAKNASVMRLMCTVLMLMAVYFSPCWFVSFTWSMDLFQRSKSSFVEGWDPAAMSCVAAQMYGRDVTAMDRTRSGWLSNYFWLDANFSLAIFRSLS